MKIKSLKVIEKELVAIAKGEPRSWLFQSDLLDAIESLGYWYRDSDSFSSWMEKNAFRFKVKLPMLWRKLTSGRYIRKIKEQLEKNGIELPDVEKIAENVGPESVELLAKLERVVPKDSFTELACTVFSGGVPRAKLKAMWSTYRPVLGGRTARGRGVIAPQTNEKDPHVRELLSEAISLQTLQSVPPDWSGHSRPKVYKVFPHITPDDYKKAGGGKNKSKSFSLYLAVVAIKPVNGEIEYHGFYLPRGPLLDESLRTLFLEVVYTDFLWVIMPPMHINLATEFTDFLPDFVGLVVLGEDKVTIQKPAKRLPKSREKQDRLVNALFEYLLES